ncbi:MAG: A24 family peptidase [bacterium]|nr:A24 family peptidase [bacterium]
MAVLCAFLAAACIYDHCRRRIPNYLTVMMAAAGIMIRCRESGIGGIAFFLAGALPVMFFLYPFFRIGALGAGDVKLFGVTAGFLPFQKILLFSFVSLLIAAIFSLFRIIRKKCIRERFQTLCDYARDVAGSKRLCLYPLPKDRESATVPLAGPILLGVLLLLGGVY